MKISLCLVQTNLILVFHRKDKVIFQEYGYNITLNHKFTMLLVETYYNE